MSTTSYGKITIIDVTDVGNFSVYPYANGPNTQIYSEETNSYYPNWEQQNEQGQYISPLVLTPVVTYAGVDKTTDSTVNWYLKTDLEHPITTGGAYVVDNSTKQLTIKANIPTANTYIVYVVKAHYISDTGVVVDAEGEITFSLLTQPSSIKNVSISGENVIKYISDSTNPIPSSVTLTAKLTGGTHITGLGWKYWTSSNDWSSGYLTTGDVTGITVNGLQLTANASYNNSAAYFNNDIAKFKYVARATEDATDIYEDVFTVTQLRDGASGTALVVMDLTNDDQLVPINNRGEAQWSSIGDLASTTVYIYRGTNNITSENPIYVTLTNVTVDLYNSSGTKYEGAWNPSGNPGDPLPVGYYKVKATGFTTGHTSGSIAFSTTVYSYEKTTDTTVTQGTTYYSKDSSTGVYSVVNNPSGNPSVLGYYERGDGALYSATFSLVGVEAGADGQTPTIYTMEFPEIPVYVNNPTGSPGAQTDNWSYSPTDLLIKAYEITTDATTGATTRSAYNGRIWYKPNIINGSPDVDSGGNQTWGYLDLTGQASNDKLPAASKLLTAYSPYTFRLVGSSQANTAANLKDEESISIISNGSTGNTGNDGKDSINLLITNENITLNATTSGLTRSRTLTVEYQGYIGATEDSNFVYTSYSCGKTGLISSVSDNSGHTAVTITFASGIAVSAGETGTIVLNFTYGSGTSAVMISKTIVWDAKLDAKDGEAAITLSFEYDGATYFKNEIGTTTVTPILIQGGTNILDNTYTITWADLITPSAAVAIDSDGISAVISATDISGVGSYSCTVSKSGKSYVQYVSFTDYSDPLQVELISTIGDKLTNGIGEGVVYPQTTRDGSILDQVSNNSLVVWGSASAPSNPAEGDFYFNTSNSTLYERSSSSWVAKSNYTQIIVLKTGNVNPIEVRNLSGSTYPNTATPSSLQYVWSFRDSVGNVLNPQAITDLKISYVNGTVSPTWTTTQVTGGQFIYVNRNVIDNKIIILCQVTKN